MENKVHRGLIKRKCKWKRNQIRGLGFQLFTHKIASFSPDSIAKLFETEFPLFRLICRINEGREKPMESKLSDGRLQFRGSIHARAFDTRGLEFQSSRDKD